MDDEVRAELVAHFEARASEHIGGPDMLRWANEEFLRLYQEHPDGVPEDLLVKAVSARMRRERPEAFRLPWEGE